MLEIIGDILNFKADGIIYVVIGGLIVFAYSGWRNFISRSVASGLMISLGIFGTFWGVYFALQPLDFSTPELMQNSVRELLNGMKIAFFTSLLGLFSSIVAKFIWSLPSNKKVKISPEYKDMSERLDAIKNAIAGDGDSSLVTQMQKLRDENREGFKQLEGLSDTNERLDAIKNAIAGEGDSSLVTQMQKLRDENHEGFNKLEGLSDTIRNVLVDNLQKMMEKLAQDLKETIAEQLGGQLKELIKSIEHALIEQFGKTFVEFNEAVQALKKWQEDHRQQVEQLTVAFDESAKGIGQIKSDCAEIPITMEKLRNIVEMANSQVTDLEHRLTAFAKMKQQAEEAFPLIKENLDKIGEDLKNSASGFHQMEEVINSSVQSIAENMRTNMEQSQRGTSERVKQIIEKAQQEFNDEINRVTQEWGQNMTAIARECAEAIQQARSGRDR